MKSESDPIERAGGESSNKPKPFQFGLRSLMLVTAAAATLFFMLRLASDKPAGEKFVLGYFAYYGLAAWIVLFGKAMATSDDLQRGSRVVTAGKWVFIAPALATGLLVAGFLLVFALWLLAGWLGFHS